MPADLFESDAWFGNLLAHGFEQPPQAFKLVLFSANGQALAHLHLMQSKPGAPLASLSNYYSCLYGPVPAVPGGAEQVAPAQWQAAGRAMRALPGGAQLRLQPLDSASAWLPALESSLRQAGYWTQRYFCFGNWYQPVPPGGFAAYWAERPSALRHSVERGRRRLAQAGRWRVDIVTGVAAQSPLSQTSLQEAMAAYEAVYNQSWKGAERCPAFMPGLMHTAASQGWLRLGVLWLNDQPVAAQVWLVHGGKANIYKLAYVKGHEKLSAGSVLTAALMQHTMDVDRVQEVDYLSGDDAYKADWMALRRERVGVVGFDQRALAGWFGALRHTAGRWVRRATGALVRH
ncbi:GNAT family N-acetyltransferase [Hydrogenophaga sp.]|uniref:GNAT family N-acetyltransferase n=1 Tax=Hydrogenophaga sp. TaxID=1904254 RepID=UPI003F6C545C